MAPEAKVYVKQLASEDPWEAVELIRQAAQHGGTIFCVGVATHKPDAWWHGADEGAAEQATQDIWEEITRKRS